MPKKIKKFTVLQSPHIDKKARLQLEIRTFKKIINISNYTLGEQRKLKKISDFFVKNLPPAITVQLKTKNQIYS
jgi:ribosomal protein S10